jgi:hypothetical protein
MNEQRSAKKSRKEKVLCLTFHASIERSDVKVLGAEGHSGQLREVVDAEIRYIQEENYTARSNTTLCSCNLVVILLMKMDGRLVVGSALHWPSARLRLFLEPLALNIRVRPLLLSPIELSYQCRASGASEILDGGSNTHLSLELYPYGREGRSTESSSIRKLRSWSQDLPRVQSPFLDVSKALSDYGRSQHQEVTPLAQCLQSHE